MSKGNVKGNGQGIDWPLSQKSIKILFFAYMILLLKVIVFKIPLWRMQEISRTWTKEVIWEGMGSANFVLFKTIKMYWKYRGRGLNSFQNLVGNVVAFIPLGYFLPRMCRIAQNVIICMLNVFLFVLCIELFQLLSAFGAFDVDDILLNCVGAFMGYICYVFFRKKWKRNV